MHFGRLLGPSWTDFGGQDGAKLAPKSVQEGVRGDVKNKQKNYRNVGLQAHAHHATNPPWAPLKTLNPRVQGTKLAALAGPRNTPTRASGHGGGYFLFHICVCMYVYIYIYMYIYVYICIYICISATVPRGTSWSAPGSCERSEPCPLDPGIESY